MPNSDRRVEVALHYFRMAQEKWTSSVLREKNPDPVAVKQLWEAVNSVLQAYCRGMNFTRHGVPKEHFPVIVADFLSDQVDDILQGRTPRPIKDMVRPGSPGVGSVERTDIGMAVGYIRAAKTGLIKDKHPVKTIAGLYGVTDRAVRYWKTKYKQIQPDFFPNLDSVELGERLAQAVKDAGFRYQRGGRGSKGRDEFPRPNKRQSETTR